MIQILRTICLKCACRLFIPFSSSWYGRRRKPLLYDSAGLRHPTSCANTRSISYLYIYSLLPTARSTTLRHQCVIHSHFFHKPNMLECDHIVISTGHSWGNVVLRYRFHAKAWGEAWERDPSSDVGIDSDGDSGRQEKYATLVQDQDPKVHVYFLNPPTLSLRRAADPAPTSQ